MLTCFFVPWHSRGCASQAFSAAPPLPAGRKSCGFSVTACTGGAARGVGGMETTTEWVEINQGA